MFLVNKNDSNSTCVKVFKVGQKEEMHIDLSKDGGNIGPTIGSAL